MSRLDNTPATLLTEGITAKNKVAAFIPAMVALTISTTGCNTQPNHPNQINAFDGASYDELTVAHAAARFVPRPDIREC